ncbi:acyltransferase family protein [Lolliginicoccus levis]|uniref:acyltransferase family protein n=1 Tax=Lolliginicoccus levis TaxID=2919542 RepID=UPI00241F687F|nr:acyltransferase family protein [Lolliginicoccus levis]
MPHDPTASDAHDLEQVAQLAPPPAASPATEPVGVATTKRPARQRIEWVDIAKGTSIILVVILHAANMLISKDLAPDFWYTINSYLQPVRMPLFFVASGLFAQGMIAMAWPRMLRSRIAHLMYLYTLWLVIFLGVHNVLPSDVRHEGYASWTNVIGGLYLPDSALWFIYALAVFAVVAKAINRLPLWLQLGAAVALNVYSQYQPVVSWSWNNLAEYFIYFLLGLHARSLIITVSRRTALPWIAAALAAYAAMYSMLADAGSGAQGLTIILTTFGLAAGVLVSAAVVGTPVGEVLNKVGRTTLPVYLMLDMFIALLGYVLIKLSIINELLVVQAIAPLAVAAGTVVLALYAHKILLALRLNWLFELPPRLRGTARREA